MPDFKFNESDEQIRYDHLTIRFDTSANEIGFCDYPGSHSKSHDSAFSSEKYYFVRSKNKSISATAPDVMIKKKSKTYMNLNDGMDAANKHTSYEHIGVINNGVFYKTNNNYRSYCLFNFAYNEYSN